MALSNTMQGALCAVLGMALLGFIDNFVKLLAQDIGLWQFHFSRSVFVLLILGTMALYFGWTLRPKRLWAVALRSFFTATSMVLYFGAVAVLPIAQVGAGLFTAPIFVLIISAVFYRMPIGGWRVFAVCLGFLGVILLLRPNADAFSWFSLIPVCAGLLYGYGAVCTRVYCADESTLTLVIGFFVILGLWGAVGLLWFAVSGLQTDPIQDGFFGTGWQSWTQTAALLTVAQAIFSLAGIGLITRAYLLAEASRIAVFEYSFLISAGFWSYILWQEFPDTLGLIGISLIIAAGAVIILRTREPL